MLSSCQLRHGGTADPSVHSWALQQSQSPRQAEDSSLLSGGMWEGGLVAALSYIGANCRKIVALVL